MAPGGGSMGSGRKTRRDSREESGGLDACRSSPAMAETVVDGEMRGRRRVLLDVIEWTLPTRETSHFV